MARRRWIYINGEAIEITKDLPPREPGGPYILGDSMYEGMTSPRDGADISSRTKHREYMKKHGLCLADDFKGEWAEAAKRRAENKDPTRVTSVVEAVRKVSEGYRPSRFNLDQME